MALGQEAIHLHLIRFDHRLHFLPLAQAHQGQWLPSSLPPSNAMHPQQEQMLRAETDVELTDGSCQFDLR